MRFIQVSQTSVSERAPICMMSIALVSVDTHTFWSREGPNMANITTGHTTGADPAVRIEGPIRKISKRLYINSKADEGSKRYNII